MITYSSMTASDATHCVALVRKFWGEKAAVRAIHQLGQMWDYELMAGDRPHFVVAKDRGNVVGFAGYRRAWVMEGTYELIWIAIESEYQGRGIGKHLMVVRLDQIRQRGGKLVIAMTKEVDFFRKTGFAEGGRVDGYTIMTLGIGNQPVEIGNAAEGDRHRNEERGEYIGLRRSA